jgi:hypothetical protein
VAQSILEGARHDLETMDDLVFWRGRGDGVISMMEFNHVQDDLTLGVTLD